MKDIRWYNTGWRTTRTKIFTTINKERMKRNTIKSDNIRTTGLRTTRWRTSRWRTSRWRTKRWGTTGWRATGWRRSAGWRKIKWITTKKTIKVKWNRQHSFDQGRRIQEKSDKDQEKRICGIWKTQIRIKNSASKYIQFGLIGRIG